MQERERESDGKKEGNASGSLEMRQRRGRHSVGERCYCQLLHNNTISVSHSHSHSQQASSSTTNNPIPSKISKSKSDVFIIKNCPKRGPPSLQSQILLLLRHFQRLLLLPLPPFLLPRPLSPRHRPRCRPRPQTQETPIRSPASGCPVRGHNQSQSHHRLSFPQHSDDFHSC